MAFSAHLFMVTQHNVTHNTTSHNTTSHNKTSHNTTSHNITSHTTQRHTQHNLTQHNVTQHNTTHNQTSHITETSHNNTALYGNNTKICELHQCNITALYNVTLAKQKSANRYNQLSYNYQANTTSLVEVAYIIVFYPSYRIDSPRPTFDFQLIVNCQLLSF